MKLRTIPMALAGVLWVAAVAWGAPVSHPAQQPVHPQSLEQAVKQVQHQTRGHILAADTVSRGRTQVYRIKVLTPRGKVQVVQLHSSPQSSGHPNKPQPEQGGH
jgi:hypothetical protein